MSVPCWRVKQPQKIPEHQRTHLHGGWTWNHARCRRNWKLTLSASRFLPNVGNHSTSRFLRNVGNHSASRFLRNVGNHSVCRFLRNVGNDKMTRSDIPENLNTKLYRCENLQPRKRNCLQLRRSASAVLQLKFLSATQLATRHELSGRH